MERHNPTLASTRVYVLDLCPKKASCFRSMFSSSMSTPFMRLGYFTKLYPSCSASRFALNGWWPYAHHSTGQPSVKFDLHIDSKCAFVCVAIVALSLDLVMHPPVHYFIRDHVTTNRCSLDPLSFMEILS
ncbi:hypothetical protein B296_00029574 [Ensete ventricosum]|uniref:Uncharacterized protein n=1 Tax=Ensete ventricosum TaxID=4639 RepID=A0A426XKQ7_ENSVE|nr:hypothetical protein B296_00029574 [Ensete ventricosum]